MNGPKISANYELITKYLKLDDDQNNQWRRLYGVKTTEGKFTLEKALKGAIQFDDLPCGIYAGDKESYVKFAEVFDNIILAYHSLDSSFQHFSVFPQEDTKDLHKLHNSKSYHIKINFIR
jgi:hypothetical protein